MSSCVAVPGCSRHPPCCLSTCVQDAAPSNSVGHSLWVITCCQPACHACARADDARVPDGAFALYLAGQFNKRTAKKAAATHGACHGYVQFNHMNHFGINDFYPGTHQARPCRARMS